MEWQPIETAPKDGTLVDLWVIDTSDGSGRRETDAYFANGKWWSTRDTNAGEPVEQGRITATHWMPLPAPPPAGEG